MKTMTIAAGLAATFCAFTAPCAAASAPEPLPAIELRLQCDDHGADAVAQEIDAIMALHDFADAHDAQVVWLDAVIEADNGAGDCSRATSESDEGERSDETGPELDRPRIDLKTCMIADTDAGCYDAAMVQVYASGPSLVLSRSVYLPAPSSLAKTLPYRMERYGDWLNYQGPFIVRYHEGTGYAYATFHQPDPALSGVWERARCNARPDDCKEE